MSALPCSVPILIEPPDDDAPDVLPIHMSDSKCRHYRDRLLQRHPYCRYCGERIAPKKATIDHVQPKSQGGLNRPDNLVLCCVRCNLAKQGRTPDQWANDVIFGADPRQSGGN